MEKKSEDKTLNLYLMTNHIHLIVEPSAEASTLSELMKRISCRQTTATTI